MKPERRGVAWFLLLALLLVSIGFIVSSMLRKLERDQLFMLEENMFKTAQTLAPTVLDVVQSGRAGDPKIFETLQTTQNVTGSRVRLLSSQRDLLYDSLTPDPEPQEHLRFRPEVQSAFVGQYGAYTRYSDETGNSLALFVACPVKGENNLVVGCVYVSHSTDEILQQLGVIRRAANRAILALSLVTLVGALLVTGQLRRTLERLGALTSGTDTVESKDIDLRGTDQVAQIGQNFNRLVANLRLKVAELEDERNKTQKFLEDVAHELKTPITGLAGSVEALQSGRLADADKERLLKNVERETARLSELTSRLLELQKLEYDQLRVEPFDLLSVGETVVDSLEQAALKKGVRLRLDESDNVIARGDAQKIQRVLENLVDNAIRCSPEGEEVVISHRVESGKVVVAVVDRGPGPPDKALFARNHQGKRFKGSLGLGLAIASEIMEMHQQELVALPREGGGSAFQFALRLDEAEDA